MSIGWGPAAEVAVGGFSWDNGVATQASHGVGLVGLTCQGCSLLLRMLGAHASYCQNIGHMFSMHHMW